MKIDGNSMKIDGNLMEIGFSVAVFYPVNSISLIDPLIWSDELVTLIK